MIPHEVTLDMDKSFKLDRPDVTVRVGERDTQELVVTLLRHGIPWTPPEGSRLKFQVKKRDGGIIRSADMEKVGEEGNRFSVDIPSPTFSYYAIVDYAYVAVYGQDGSIATSSDLKLTILPGTTDEEMVRFYDADIEDAKRRLTDGEANRNEAEDARKAAEEARVEAEKKRVTAETAREEAESSRDTAEKARVKAETERDSSESERRSSEQQRELAEQKRAANEVERGTAESERKEAETARGDAEDARVEAEDARKEAEQKRSEAESARETAESDRDTAETARASAETARERSEASREDAEAKREAAEADRQQEFDTNEAQRQEDFETAEAERQKNEDARVTAETARDTAEKARDAAEKARESAETARDDAETARAAAEELRVSADADRAERQTANDAQQAKNNADQAANNLAAQGRLTRILKAGEYDPDTRVPTIEGDLTHVFAVPTPEADAAREALEVAKQSLKQAQADASGSRPSFDGQLELATSALAEAQATYEAANRYVEWLWLIDDETQEGYWEQYGSGNTIILDPISTEEYDRMWAGESVETKHVAYSSGESYNVSKIREALQSAKTAQEAVDSKQDESISKAQSAAETAQQAAETAASDAADALESAVTTQGEKDKAQDESIAAAKSAADKAQERADEAYNHLPDVVSNDADGLAPKFGGSEGYLHNDGETATWQTIPLASVDGAGLAPQLPGDAKKVWLGDGSFGEYKAGGMPDYRALKKALADANALKESAKVGGGDLDFGSNVTDQDSLDAYTGAIAKAQAVLDKFEDPSTTQEALDAAKGELDAATETFRASCKPVQPDKSGLTTQESRYTTLKQDVSVSADGKDVAFGSKWVRTQDQTTADAALTTARNAVNAAKKQSEIDSAVSTLKSAIDAYEKAIKTATADTSALDAAISAANTAKTDVKTSDTDGSDLPSGSQYVTTEQMTTFNAAISAATTAKTESTTQAQLDAATEALKSATTTFSGQVKTNWSAPENISSASWEDIERLSALAAESPQDYAKYLGQTKVIDMSSLGNGCTNVTVMIIGIGHDEGTSGEKLGFTFQFRDGLPYQGFKMNDSDTNSGGWETCKMRTTYIKKVEDALPAELKSRLKVMKKKTYMAESAFSGGSPVETQDKLALLSQTEVFGDETNPQSSWTWPKGEGKQYDWYKQHNTANDRIIKRADGSAGGWWLRSVRSTNLFRSVGSSGSLDRDYASVELLPCACFSV